MRKIGKEKKRKRDSGEPPENSSPGLTAANLAKQLASHAKALPGIQARVMGNLEQARKRVYALLDIGRFKQEIANMVSNWLVLKDVKVILRCSKMG